MLLRRGKKKRLQIFSIQIRKKDGACGDDRINAEHGGGSATAEQVGGSVCTDLLSWCSSEGAAYQKQHRQSIEERRA